VTFLVKRGYKSIIAKNAINASNFNVAANAVPA
jgi:hypothetical protein